MNTYRQDSTDSHVLLDRAKAGDAEALEALLATLQPQIYRFGRKMCRSPEDAEDILQDTLLTVARGFRDFRGASSLSTWLYSIARSYCLKKRRKEPEDAGKMAPLEALPPSLAPSSLEPTPEERVQQNETWQELQEAIYTLAPNHREVLVLRDVEGLTTSEVAEVIGITEAAVKSRLHRAREELRNVLHPEVKPRPNCPEIANIYSQFLEGELSKDVCAQMQAHVDGCEACTSECAGLKETLDACRSSPATQPPMATKARVRKALDEVLKPTK